MLILYTQEMLDDFSTTKLDSTPIADPGPSGPGRPPTNSTAHTADVPLEPAPVDEDEFAKQLQAGMADMLRQLQSNPEAVNEFEQIMSQLGGGGPGIDLPMPPQPQPLSSKEDFPSAESTSASNPPLKSTTATVSTLPATEDVAFQDTIRRTMDRMKASSASAATTSRANPSEDDIMASLLRELASSSGVDGGASDDSFSKMLLGMMEQLTNKDILYEPMKELDAKFPPWLEERTVGGKKGSVKEEEMERYREQRILVRQIVERFERKGYSDEDARDREFIVERMQKVRRCE